MEMVLKLSNFIYFNTGYSPFTTVGVGAKNYTGTKETSMKRT